MRTGFRISSLVPRELVFDSVSDSTDSIILTVRSDMASAGCPLCGMLSRRIHSRYLRLVADLPCAEKATRRSEVAGPPKGGAINPESVIALGASTAMTEYQTRPLPSPASS